MLRREETSWSQVLAIAGPLVVGGLGVAATTLGNPSVWRSFFWYGGWALALFGLSLPIWKAWPTIRRLRLRSPFYLAGAKDPSVQIAALEEKVKFEDLQRRKALADRSQMERERDSALDALAREQEAHRQTKVDRDALARKIRYDIDTWPSFEDNDPLAIQIARNDLKLMWQSLGEASRLAFMFIHALRGGLWSEGDVRDKVIARYFDKHCIHPTTRLYDRLSEEVTTNPDGDFRPWLVLYYEAYNELRRTMAVMANFQQQLISELPEYGEWRAHDKEFLRRIREMAAVHDEIDAINRRRGYPVSMPD